MSSIVRPAAFWLTTVSGVILSGAAFAQAASPQSAPQVTPPPVPTYIGMTAEDVGVMDRNRPEYDAKGIPMGGFRLFPTLDVTASYDDNVRFQPVGTADWYFLEAPAFRLQSQWGRDFLEFFGGLNNYNYAKDTALNLTDWDLGGDGRLDVSRELTISATASYAENHESLASPNTTGFQASPNRYYQPHGEISATYQPNRLGFGVGGQIDHFDFLNTPDIGGGTLYNGDRNDTEYQAYAKTFYDFSPGYSGFVKASYDDQDYQNFLDRGGYHRSNNGFRFDGGLDLQISHLVKGEVYAGYLEQHFSQNVAKPLHDVSGLDYGVNLDWFAQQDLTVHLTGSHTLTDMVLSGVSVSDNDNVRLSADYEAAYDIILQGYAGYTNSHLTGTTRVDQYPSAGIKAKYLMNEYLAAYVGYDYSNRSSNFPGLEFNANLVTLGITGHI